MRKLTTFMHTSLDGFAAGPKGEMDWIHVDEEIFEYASARTHDGDTALYGRVTYQMMDAYWPTAADRPNASRHDIEHSRWYNRVEKVVISRSLKGTTKGNVTIVSDNLAAEIQALKERPGKDILVFGSPGASHSLMADDLIDDYWLFVNPVLLGQGIPVFSHLRHRAKLKLVASRAFASGVVCLHYESDRS